MVLQPSSFTELVMNEIASQKHCQENVLYMAATVCAEMLEQFQHMVCPNSENPSRTLIIYNYFHMVM